MRSRAKLMADDLRLAFAFLTVLPMGRIPASPQRLGNLLAYFPVVGAFIGLLLAGVYWMGMHLWEPAVVAWGIVACWAVLTGNLHLDGLADSADGIFGGRSPSQRLEIMTDSRVGTHGVVALILMAGAKYLLLRQVLTAWDVWRPLVVAAATGRWAAVYACCVYRYARPEGGVGRCFADEASWLHLAVASAVCVGLGLGCLGVIGLAAVVGAAVITVLLACLAARHVGGVTGDVCGALVEMTEALSLAAVAALPPA